MSARKVVEVKITGAGVSESVALSPQALSVSATMDRITIRRYIISGLKTH
jgi:hypothetical protein